MTTTVTHACGHSGSITLWKNLPSEPQRIDAERRNCPTCLRARFAAARVAAPVPAQDVQAPGVTSTPVAAQAPAHARVGRCIDCGDPTPAPHLRWCSECYDPASAARYRRATGRTAPMSRYAGDF